MTETQSSPEIAILSHLAAVVGQVVAMNCDGVEHAASLTQPKPGGNCMNWVLGHLVSVYNQSLGLFGEEPVEPKEALARYERGSDPVTGPGDARDFGELLELWRETSRRHEAGLAALDPAKLSEPAPFGPDGAPKEGDTIGTLLATIQFHQAYHAGQLGVLRRIAGKRGAIP